jgi:hypothetical protein
MTNKAKARHRQANRPMPSVRTPPVDGLSDGLDDVGADDAARSVARSSDIQRPAWTVPHIETTEASGDPFMASLEVSGLTGTTELAPEAKALGPSAAARHSAGLVDARTVMETPVTDRPLREFPMDEKTADVTAADERPATHRVGKPGWEEPAHQTGVQHSNTPQPTAARHAGGRPLYPPHAIMAAVLRGQWLIGNQMLAQIEENERAALRAVAALLKANTVAEAMAVQIGFAAGRFAAAGRQSAQWVELIGRLSGTDPAEMRAPRQSGYLDRWLLSRSQLR